MAALRSNPAISQLGSELNLSESQSYDFGRSHYFVGPTPASTAADAANSVSSAPQSPRAVDNRFDPAHQGARSPFYAMQWSDTIGWHTQPSPTIIVGDVGPLSDPRQTDRSQNSTHVPQIIGPQSSALLRKADQKKSPQKSAPETNVVPRNADRRVPATSSLAPVTRIAAKSSDAANKATQLGHLHAWHDATSNAQEPTATPEQNLEQILAEAAHDIRSPLSIAQQIISTVNLNFRHLGKFGKREADLLDMAGVRLQQASGWAESVLLNRNLSHGQPVNLRRRFYPHQWQNGIAPLLDHLASERRVKIEWNGWDRSLPRLYLDPRLLSRVVVNLCTNAIQASRASQTVRISVTWQTHVTQRLLITIEDSAGGLDTRLMRQVNATALWPEASDDCNPSGLGLKTAKTLVRTLGGSLSVQRAVLGGTVFRIALPVDNYHSLIRNWLLHAYDSVDLVRLDGKLENHPIEIYAIRCADEAAQFVDSQLQLAATRDDLIYRVSDDRWLWLKILRTSNLHRPVAEKQFHGLDRQLIELAQDKWAHCRSQRVFRLQSAARDVLQPPTPGFRLPEITSRLAERIAELIGNRVPQIDDLNACDQLTAFINVRALETKTKVARQLRPDVGVQGTTAPHTGNSSPSPAALINAKKPAVRPRLSKQAAKTTIKYAETQSPIAIPATAGRSLAEVAAHWYATQNALDKVLSSVSASPRSKLNSGSVVPTEYL